MFKIIKYIFLLAFLGLIALPFMVLDTSPRVVSLKQISPQALKVSQGLSSRVANALAGSSREIEIYRDELKTALDVISYSVPHIALSSELTPLGMQVSATGRVKIGDVERYVNGTCILFNGTTGVEFESCWLGSLKLPGAWVEKATEYFLANYVGQNAFSAWFQIVKNAQIEDNKLILRNVDGAEFRAMLKGTAGETSGLINGGASVDSQLVEHYLSILEKQRLRSRSLGEVTQYLFNHVLKKAPVDNDDLAKHNLAAIWALTIKYGSNKFAHFAQVSSNISRSSSLTLSGRGDLALHFLYSAFLQLNSDEQTAFNIGELKELMDTNKGGSGFSFPDLVADKAGVQFAKYLTDPQQDLRKATEKLALVPNESVFMGQIKDKPEGISQQAFERQYRDLNSENYRSVVRLIEQEIVKLALYL